MTAEAPNRNLLRRVRPWLWILFAIVSLTAVALWMRERPAVSSASQSYASAFGGSFEMIDQYGNTVTDQTLRGRPYAMFFGFTRCPDVCPTTLSRLAALRKQLGADGEKFDIVFVSVDPKTDKANDIGRYVKLFDTPIIGLTGSDRQIAKIAKAFHVYYAKIPVDGGGYTVDHTASVFLMDKHGEFVATIDHKESQQVALAKLKRLV